LRRSDEVTCVILLHADATISAVTRGWESTAAAPSIILYDGVCCACDRFVRFILRHDRAALFRFAPLQSATATRMLSASGRGATTLSSVVLVENGRCLERSDAAIRIMSRLGFPWNLAGILSIVPRALRDILYDWFAAHRYGWFGRRETCAIPPPEWRGRFLD
jgi:predicted DCC family thiol-disulfide oxidoreductase YuxK